VNHAHSLCRQHSDQIRRIRFFGWYLHTERNQNRFNGTDIGHCYVESHTGKPTSISPFLNDMHNRNPKMLLRDSGGWYMERSVRERLQAKYGRRPTAIRVEKILMELSTQVPDVAERDFLNEALNCYKAGAFRAAIVMTWNLAYDHLLSYLLRHKLAEFNKQWPINLTKQHSKARVSAISNRDEFSEIKESELLVLCKSAALISPDVFKIIDEKLGKRNSAAHPSGVNIGQLQAENFIDEIVKNVVLKIVV
jgi:hypothetical protein